MIYSILPIRDTTIYENYSDLNTGLDSILELNKAISTASNYNSRILMKFDLEDIQNEIGAGIITNPRFYLNLYVTEANEIPFSYTIEAYPISQSWDMGIGRFSDRPYLKDGATWEYRDNVTSKSSWFPSSSFALNSTGSYSSVMGGGSWYTDYTGSEYFENRDADVRMDVTTIVMAWINNSCSNEGLIIKWSDSDEINYNDFTSLKFFSVDSHTVFVPKLEIAWDDSSFITGSSILQIYISSASKDSTLGPTDYPNISIPAMTENTEVSSSDLPWIISSASIYENKETLFLGKITTGSISGPDVSGSFVGEFRGYLNANFTGSYSGEFLGQCNDIVYSSTVTATSISTVSSSFNGYFNGYFSGSTFGNFNGTYQGEFTGSFGSALISTSSINLTTFGTVEHWYISGSKEIHVKTINDLEPIPDGSFVIYPIDLKPRYKEDSLVRIHLGARAQYPQKTFSTSSIYLDTKYLPETTYYSVVDAHSETVVLPFDDNFTKVSCDTNGNYFDLKMGFMPERNYRFVFKIVRGQNIEYFDKRYYFKVIR